jgi:penicillin-binding protein 2
MERGNVYSDRKYVIAIIVASVVLIYIARLFYIQLIDDSYKVTAYNQAFRYETDYAARGNIFDRNGKRLVYNQAAFDLMVIPSQVKGIDTMEFCQAMGIDKASFIKRMEKARRESMLRPSIFEKELSVENSSRIQEKIFDFPGFFVQSRTLRKYPMSVAAHILGYVGEVSPEIVDTSSYYRMGDYMGISGIEKSYEKELRGVRGTRIMMVDVHNRPKGSYMNGQFDTAAVAGTDLYSTLDLDLQLYAEQLLKNKVGSVVAIEPSTGEILVLATSPTYDPNLLVGSIRSQNYAILERDSLKPLYNRALMSFQPPGSTFKIVESLIGQQEGFLYPSTLHPCNAGYPPTGGKPGCHRHASPLNLAQAIQFSCNSYFTYVFHDILENRKYHSQVDAFEQWRKYVMSFGIGTRLECDIPNVLKGSLPTVAYYNKVFGVNQWRASTIFSLGIGQGEIGITALQNANIVSIIANRGYYITPHIVKYVGNDKKIDPKWLVKHYTMVTDTVYYNNVIEGMSDVVEGGTAARSKIPGIDFCGKTGTAQNPHGDNHSVFIGFAPKNNPKIAIAVLIENAGQGAWWAAPIASLLIEKYLTGEVKRTAFEKLMLESDLIHNPSLKHGPPH